MTKKQQEQNENNDLLPNEKQEEDLNEILRKNDFDFYY